jgi:TPR repeat protein
MILFTQPDESHYGECPICCLPLPLDGTKSSINSCCCKYICKGCSYANKLREEEQRLEQKCPYCRKPVPKTDEEIHQNLMKRAKVNDPAALFKLGVKCHDEGDYKGAFEYFTKAAAFGDMMAHYNLSALYHEGKGTEKDDKKKIHHTEEAAIGGYPIARHNLGNHEWNNGRIDRAAKHYIIAAKIGDDGALDQVKKCFQMEFVSKEDYEATLRGRGHQAAVDATKSKQRERTHKNAVAVVVDKETLFKVYKYNGPTAEEMKQCLNIDALRSLETEGTISLISAFPSDTVSAVFFLIQICVAHDIIRIIIIFSCSLAASFFVTVFELSVFAIQIVTANLPPFTATLSPPQKTTQLAS